MIKQKDYLDLVNRSGFPLQIGIASAVARSERSHGWRVLYQEHSWANQTNNSSGFLDLVLENQYRTVVFLVECKRVLETDWIFLIPSENASNCSFAKAWVTRLKGDDFKCFDWYGLDSYPKSLESSFCVMPKDAPHRMLEKIASELVSATEGFAEEEMTVIAKQSDALRVYFPVIVTTAKLRVCRFDGDAVSMSDGKVPKLEIEDVPFVRFRKQLSTRIPRVEMSVDDIPFSLSRHKERTVFVVNSEEFISFLNTFEVRNDSLSKLV